MVFSSITFLFVFLPAFIIIYYIIGDKFRNLFLFLASLLFYAWGEPRFVLVLLFSIVINYAAGLLVEVWGKGTKAGPYVVFAAVAANLGLLFYFKYTNFFVENINHVFGFLHISLLDIPKVVLPLGISFFTFQGLSYVVDVYKKQIPAQKNFINLGMYKALFPQLIAGPIVRYQDIKDQIVTRNYTFERFEEGVCRFILGLGKKVILANCLGELADSIIGLKIDNLSGPMAWLGMIAFMLQLYFDFSGYSDMAIGLGKMIGFDFKENFRYPYISKSMSEVWTRWHISLTTWLRDYIFLSLGTRVSTARLYANLLLTFALSGFWHGANWSFVLWGLWNGLFLVLERVTKFNKKKWLPDPLRWAYTMLAILIGLVLFRLVSMKLAVSYLGTMFGFGGSKVEIMTIGHYLNLRVVCTLAIAFLACTPLFREKFLDLKTNSTLVAVSRYAYYGLVFIVSIILVMNDSYNPFLYYKF